MAAVSPFVIFSGIVFVAFILGLHNFFTDYEENGCEMTYMFEYPQYVRISLPGDITRRYTRYGLYAYGEGHKTVRLRRMKFSGIPVLFIPGNSGSHKQVRSLASVSLRKTLNSHTPFHFDYFSVDLNEEYSALFGGVLLDQTDFVHHCLRRILELYENNTNKPTSVVLIGHSMGGMVAKGLFLDPNFEKSMVHVIITLVTPHKSPVLALDSFIARYYDSVNAYWRANRRADREADLSHVTFASIGGGHRDILVRSGLTQAEEADVNVVSTAVPSVWLSTDHLCSVWCKELVLVIVRTLFDIVNLTTKQVSENVQERNLVFHYHMLQRTAGKRFSTAFHPHNIYFDQNAVWKENLQRQFTFHEPNGVLTETHIMIRLLDDPKHEMLAVEAVNIGDKDWVFACVADIIHNEVRMCYTGINLSNETKFLPSRHFKRKFVYLSLLALKQKSFTHVVLRVKPTREMVQFNVDIHSSSSHHIAVSLPKWVSFMSKSVVLDLTPNHAVYYELVLPGFEQAWQAYLLHIHPQECQKIPHHAVATMRVPWSREDVHVIITESVHKTLHLKLQSSKPASYNSSEHVKVTLVLDPKCKYSLGIQSGMLDSLGQLARFYSPMLLPYLVAILLLTLREQLRTLMETGHCIMFHAALAAGAKPYYILPAVKIGARVLGISEVFSASLVKALMIVAANASVMLVNFYQPTWHYSPEDSYLPYEETSFAVLVYILKALDLRMSCWSIFLKILHPLLPLPDLIVLQDQNLDFLLLSLYLYAVAYGAAYFLGLCCWLAIIFSGHTAHKMALRFLARSLTRTLTLSEWAMAGLSKLPAAVAAFLIALMYSTCGALSLCVGAAFFFLKLCKMYEDYLEDLFKYSLKLVLGRKKKSEASKKPQISAVGVDDDDNSKDDAVFTSSTGNIVADDKNKNTAETKTETQHDVLHDADVQEEADACGTGETADSATTGEEDCAGKCEEPVAETSSDVKVELKSSENSEYSFSELHFTFTALLLWLSVTLQNAPCVLVWAHNYRFSVRLEPDPSFETSLILCLCVGILWQGKFPKPNLRYYQWVMHSLYILAILTLTYAPLSLHHLGPIVATAFVIITLHQVFAGLVVTSATEDNPSVGNQLLSSTTAEGE